MASSQHRCVFVGNIPYDATEEQLIEICREVGPVVSFRLKSGTSRGKMGLSQVLFKSCLGTWVVFLWEWQLVSMAFEEAREQVKLVVDVEREVEKLTRNLRAIKAVLNDAEHRQVKEESVRLWLDELKDASYDMEDVVDEWNTARLKLQIEGVDQENALVPQKKVCSCFPAASCYRFKQVFLRYDIALKIKEVNATLDDIARRRDMFHFVENVIKGNEIPDGRVPTISSIDESEIFGRENEKNELINKLLCESSGERKGPSIVSLVGMGGIGKTTLAQLAYNNDIVKGNFTQTIWVCVSEPFDESRIARAIIEALEGSASNLSEFNSLMQRIKQYVAGKKFLLVLDDMWNEDFTTWEPFNRCLKNGLHGSKILITTRKETVAHMMGSIDIISVNQLSENECWSLFKPLAFFGKSIAKCERLEKLGQKIVGKCRGLPLAAKTIGCLLRSKNTEEEWQNILESEMWELEDVRKGLLAPLLLSYIELPSMVKLCFSYCAVFPKGYTFKKDRLIKLWMAQGYLKMKGDREMEEIGQEYFNILASRSFFQEFERDDDGEIIRCKIYDIVHDFAQFLRKNECLTIEIHGGEESFLNSCGGRVRHLMLTLYLGALLPISIYTIKRLQSLLISESVDFSSVSEVLPQLFDGLTCLRVLDFSAVRFYSSVSMVKEIPTNIKKLIHLRYLNLSGQMEIETLPETLCELYNLQLLDISNCFSLKELPQGIGKLINMRYLLNDGTSSLSYMPVGMGRLTSLRVVKMFVVGECGGCKGCRLESLKNLNLLRECSIEGLGDVSDVGEAHLEKKAKLIFLKLNFDSRDGVRRKNEEDERLLEALQPPPNLKNLEMYYYRGNNIFPKHWMVSLTNLRSLFLSQCRNCEYFPPLGKLPSLESLDIYRMDSVKRVGNEFLGIESDTDDGSVSSSVNVIAFPKLKRLGISDMESLEEWDYGVAIKREIMPRLSSLSIDYCPKLKAVPDHLLQKTTLQELKIFGCRILKERYKEGIGEDWHKISNVPKINIDFTYQRGY